MLARVMASMLSLIGTARPPPAPAPEAAVVPAALQCPVGDVVAIGDGTGLHLHPHQAVGLLIPGPVPTLVVIDVSPAAAVKTIADTAVDATAAPHHAAIGFAIIQTAAHLPQIDPQDTETTGPAPDRQGIRTDTRGQRDGQNAGCPDPLQEQKRAPQSLQEVLSL